MDPNALAIPLAFILLAAVLCLLLIGSKWRWWQKLALILIVPAFGLVVWGAIASYKGWPTTADTPEKAMVYWALVREPDPQHGDPGAIYLWLMPMDGRESSGHNPLDYVSPGNEPRAYKLPYSRPGHRGAQRAQKMIREGRPVVFDRTGKNGGGQGDGDEGDGSGDGAEGQGGPGGPPGYGTEPDRQDFQIYELPPAHPPAKQPED